MISRDDLMCAEAGEGVCDAVGDLLNQMLEEIYEFSETEGGV